MKKSAVYCERGKHATAAGQSYNTLDTGAKDAAFASGKHITNSSAGCTRTTKPRSATATCQKTPQPGPARCLETGRPGGAAGHTLFRPLSAAGRSHPGSHNGETGVICHLSLAAASLLDKRGPHSRAGPEQASSIQFDRQ